MPLFSKKTPPFISAVIVAAGSATRMDGLDKQQVLLDGIPVIAQSVGCLNDCPRISEIIVVCREERIAEYYSLVRFYGFEKVTSVVAGGNQRQDSVFAGIRACNVRSDFFAIHDGARPLVLPEDVEHCIDAAIETGAAALGVPVRDTMKICGNDGVIISTPCRDNLFAIQTPQIFDAGIYKKAMSAAIRGNRVYTDDCQLVENIGHPVVVSRGSHDNIKITTPEDIALAGALLAFRKDSYNNQ